MNNAKLAHILEMQAAARDVWHESNEQTAAVRGRRTKDTEADTRNWRQDYKSTVADDIEETTSLSPSSTYRVPRLFS